MSMQRGRPVNSKVRQNMVEILHYLKKGYGYEIYKIYCAVFPKVTLRLMYYHLKKGAALEEFRIDKVAREKGHYSWGPEAEKIYYELGKNAQPLGSKRIKNFLAKLK